MDYLLSGIAKCWYGCGLGYFSCDWDFKHKAVDQNVSGI